MNRRNKFRALVISTNLGYALSALLSVYLYSGQFDAAFEVLPKGIDIESYFSNTVVSVLALVVLIGVWAASFLGLLFFKNWGRILTVIGFIAGLPCIALFGPTIEFGWESALNELFAVCYGIILAVMYLQPISEEFNKSCQARPFQGQDGS